MRIFKFVLCLGLLTFIYSSASINNAKAATTDSTTMEYNLDTVKLSEFSHNINELKSFINIPGNTIIFKGEVIDKLPLYRAILQPLHIPLFLEDDEFSKINPDAQLNSDTNSLINEEKNIIVPSKTTLIAVYNANGKITVLQNEEPIADMSKVKSFKKFVNTEDENQFVQEFKDDMNRKISKNNQDVVSTTSVGDILTSIRKTFSVNGSYTPPGGSNVSYIAGQAVTDYILYANSTGTHFFVKADSQIAPAGVADSNNSVWTAGYKSNIRTNSSSNYLISWSPNTTGLSLDSGTEYQIGANVSGTGIELSFNYTWQGKSSTTMQGLGDKTTGLTTNYYLRNGSLYSGYGLASSKFTVGHGALINATNKILSFSASHQFGNGDMYSNGLTWYSTTATNLSYAF
ncbi:hypothetical protein [Paenibacillus caui]|uniref:hypothetical protein n=1 Tax=Paenibacillus caui TaxID=2873927 RepID=UPI001CA9DD28|nr:hypothetical protein [Paenibacillus caui]